MGELRRRLAMHGKELSVAVEVGRSDEEIRLLAQNADYVVAMIYDEHGEQSAPGPITSITFLSDNLRRITRLVPPQRLVLGVGIYGYDWRTGTNTAESITNAEVMTLASGYRDEERPSDVIDFDPAALQPTFQYMDEDGRQHEVWFQDAVSVANAMTMARRHHLRGAALWALGEEDPGSWQAFGRRASPAPDLHAIANNDRLTFTGNGELLRVVSTPHAGRRTYERDAGTGLITDETYDSYPSAWNIRRSGAPDHVVALTFDDGPDPRWTPQILDILRRRHVPATFFMVGSAAATHPDLVRRVFAEGHEIGNHSFTHPNMAHVSEGQVRLELTATTRAIESAVGRTVTLFRPPFNADSEPGSYGEIMPMAVAGGMNYVTAGESIDPEDWNLTRTDAAGRSHPLAADEIVRSVLQDAARGHAILLHDAGGDRSRTVAALEPIITALQARGYRFVAMGALEGRGRDVTMPPLSAEDRTIVFIDGLAFAASRAVGAFLFWGFSIAIVLGLLRISLMIGLAAGRRERAPPSADGAPPPRVDVMVAAYNEAAVIARTLQSILASRGADLRVIVVDDGSSDGTADIVARDFAADPRVTLLRKANGGKASALNMALAAATAPIVVGVDADTQLSRTAVARLAAWFANPAVGAVAGNVKVGNIGGLVTRWQSIEYITSQNIDRRALARLNAITVVPGAIGGWRTDSLRAVGGYSSDTLAEDMDLTWRIRRAGWRIANEPLALAYTEAPETLNALLRQRFRWAFGTLQCLWKHRAALFRHGAFGWLALPSLWAFQIAGQILAPLIDLQLLVALATRLSAWIASLQHADIADSPDPTVWVMLAIYAAFIALEVAAGWVAYGFDREKRRDLWLLPTQRLVYRQIMYVVVWRSLMRALQGLGHAWGKLHRSGQVRVAEAET
jgi:cellulose synthase/poly-beta-1,6-N-acetylglucosamine synthase-like glycosyltransferase/peptidoglycan/xylan/chitin deacetylase (PgdA/CDA1 family)